MGRATILITDVTRMSGDQVCVAGLDQAGRSVRPVLETRRSHTRADLRLPDGTVVRPRGLLTAPVRVLSRLRRPHLEDLAYQRAGATVARAIAHDEFLKRLDRCCDRTARQVFGNNLQGEPKAYALPDKGDRSLGTVRALVPVFFDFEERDARLKPRITFRTAGDDVTWDFPVVDLAFLGLVECRRKTSALSVIEMAIFRSLCECSAIYVRLGLARPFKGADWPEERCYVQAISIHTEPDYLGGRCWADFYPL